MRLAAVSAVAVAATAGVAWAVRYSMAATVDVDIERYDPHAPGSTWYY